MHDMSSRGVVRSVLAAACLLLVTAATCSSPDAAPSTTTSPAVNASDAALLPPGTADLPAMDVAGFDELRSQVRGTPLVVNLWASWCVPCRDEAPSLADAAATHGSTIQFLGVDVQDNRADAAGFIREHRLSYPSVFDVPGAIMTDLGIVGPPATFFYRADGTLLRSVPGQISADDLDRGVRELLDEA